MSKRSRKAGRTAQRTESPAPGSKNVAGLAVVFVVVVIGSVLLARFNSQPVTVTPTPVSPRRGNVQYCVSTPPFVYELGFTQTSAFDTRAQFVEGLALRELNSSGNIVRSYEHPSWSSGGYLGSYQRDATGNVYIISIPFISILDNPPDKANIIYRIDNASGVMEPFIDLPAAAPPTPENVYGLLDITYDCDTNSVYASSVAGSTYDHVAGRIYQIDATSGEVVSALDGIDAFGVGVYNGAHGKRLYFGMARTPEIYSIALDENGHFIGPLRFEISLEGMGAHREEHARALTFQEEARLLVEVLQFDFNLVAPTEIRKTLLGYSYDAQTDTWQILASEVVSG